MKSKSKVFLAFALSVLFLSCSNLFQANKDKGSVSIQLPQINPLISEQKLSLNKNKLRFILNISGNADFSMEKEAVSGEKIEIELEAGNYSVDAVAYNSDDTVRQFPLYKGSGQFAIAGGETSKLYLIMKRIPAAEFTKNVLDKASGEYNYTWGGDLIKLYPDFNKVLKRGDCFTVTFKGKANTAFNGTFDAVLATGSNKNNPAVIAKESSEISFNAGDAVSVSFDIMVESDARDKNDTQFYLSYEKEACDEVMAFNEYSIEFNFKPNFTRIEHNIHIGDRVYYVYSKSGYEFVLPDADELNQLTNNNFHSFILDGYYTNESFTGNKVNTIAASDNTKAMHFYLKPVLHLKKNNSTAVSEEGAYYSSDIRIKDFTKGSNGILFKDLPASGETLYFTFEGIAGKDFEGELGCELIEDSVKTTVLDSQKAELNVKKDEKFLLYYELTVPEDKSLVSFANTGFNFFYDSNSLDEDFTISDIKVTLYGGKYGEDYKPLKLDISVELPEYKTGNISISQTNTDQGLEFACEDSELTRKGIELTSYDWILSYLNEDERLSTEKAFVLTNEKKSSLEYNGFYALSLIAHDADGNMYAETAYLTLANENGKPMHNVPNGPVLEVTLPSDYSQGKLKIEQSATENNGTKFTVLNLLEEYEYCMWTFEDEVVSRTASYELTGEEKAKLEQKKYVLSFFVKEKDGTYYDAEIYINIIK
jgi:hypothetical protein